MRWAFWRAAAPVVPPERIAVGNFALQAQLAGSSGQSMNVAGYIYSDDDERTLNARLDLYQAVIGRQRSRSEIPELEAKREQMVKGMMQARDILSDLEKRQENGDKLSSQEKLNLQNLSVNIAKVKDEIDKGDEAIREAKLKAGAGA